MSKNTNSNNPTQPVNEPEVYYVAHRNHLHDFDSKDEAEAVAKTFGGRAWSGSELVFSLEERPRFQAVVVAVAELLMEHDDNFGGECTCPVCQKLRSVTTELAIGVEDAFRAGRLDASLTPEKKAKMTEQLQRLDLTTKVQSTLVRKVRVVASRPAEGQEGVTDLIGKEFSITGYNPHTEQVQVDTGDARGVIILGPDEYVFTDEKSVAAAA